MLKGVQYCVAYIDFFMKIIQNFQNRRERESGNRLLFLPMLAEESV